MVEDKVYECIKKYNMISEGDTVVVAVSGGPDSMCLLNCLINLKTKLNFKIVVAHVNHMIRAVADSETEYVKEFCKKKGIECSVKKVDVIKLAEEQKISTEECGRNVRYEFFDEVFKRCNATKIAIAHNKNDNVETVLMNIMRGSGVSGLKGIEPTRVNKFIRPLIEVDRSDIEAYCEEKQLNPKFDESNNENIYTRNKIRNLLIPFIKKEFNPNIIDSVNRLSNLATGEIAFVDKYVKKELENLIICEGNTTCIKLNLKKFNLEDRYIKSRIILECISKIFGSTKGVEKIHIDDIIILAERNIGNKFLTPNKHLKVSVGKGILSIEKV